MSSPALPTARHFVTQLLNSLPSLSHPAEGNPVEANPLVQLPTKAKEQLLSLQVLFPNEFVPALDLLDRRLVTRFRICEKQQQQAAANQPQSAAANTEEVRQPQEVVQSRGPYPNDDETLAQSTVERHVEDEVMADAPEQETATITRPTPSDPYDIVYYVRSAQQRSSRFSTSYDTTTTYEVRLQAWNCSCPAFAFNAFPATHLEPPTSVHDLTIVQGIDSESKEAYTGKNGWSFGGISLGDGMPPVCKHLLACVLVEKCSGIFGAFVQEKNVSVEEAAGWAAGWGD